MVELDGGYVQILLDGEEVIRFMTLLEVVVIALMMEH
jgi:hypothetical protein